MQIIDDRRSPNFHTPAGALEFYKMPRIIESNTAHHWGDPRGNPTFEGVVDHLCNPATQVSAHTVSEAGRIQIIVDFANVSWHSGNNKGNTTSIGHEMNPLCRDDDYVAGAHALHIANQHAGRVLPLFPHSFWKPTACPGNYDLNRLDRMQNELWNGNNVGAPPVVEVVPPAPAPPQEVPSVQNYHVVQGNSFDAVASWLGTTPHFFRLANPGIDYGIIHVGQVLRIPSVQYGVKTGDTMGKIAQNHGMTLEQLLRVNEHKRANPGHINVGEILTVVLR